MPSIIFDFDSTLVSIETLDYLLAKKIQDPTTKAALAEITDSGMSGEITFAESLNSRLKLATPTKQEVDAFAGIVPEFLTPGMPALIENLRKKNWDIWILSGGLIEIILPCAKQLGIHEDHVGAVEVEWDDNGQFLRINEKNQFNISKVAGLKALKVKLLSPSVAVGDGMTDFALFDDDLVDHFVGFTGHKQHQQVIDQIKQVAAKVDELKDILRAFNSE